MEEAERKCGSETKLQAAMLRGAVVKLGNDGEEPLYYFKSVEVGEEEAFDEVLNLSKNKTTTGGAYEAMRDMIHNMGRAFKSKQSDLESVFGTKRIDSTRPNP